MLIRQSAGVNKAPENDITVHEAVAVQRNAANASACAALQVRSNL